MNAEDLAIRTKKFAVRIVRLSAALPRSREADVLGRQILRSGTSIGANYREARRARSRADFLSKIGVCNQEADETFYWLELLGEGRNRQSKPAVEYHGRGQSTGRDFHRKRSNRKQTEKRQRQETFCLTISN